MKVNTYMKASKIPYITIIVPVYNCESYISECISSIKNQTLINFEVICIDDGSTDKSLEIMRSETSSDPRFTVISLKKNGGLGHARNVALNIAKGYYIQCVDADDYILENCCEILYKTAKNLNLDILMYSGKNFHTKNQFIVNPYWEYSYLPEGFKSVFNYIDCYGFIEKLPVSSGINFYRKGLLNDNKIRFPEGVFFEDQLFFLKAFFNASRVSIKNEKLYMRRVHNHSITQNWTKHMSDYVDVLNLKMNYFYSCNYIPPKYMSDLAIKSMNAMTDRYENLSQVEQLKLAPKIKEVVQRFNIKDTIFSHLPKFGIIRQRDAFRQLRLFGVPLIEYSYANLKKTFILRIFSIKIFQKTKKPAP